MKASTLTLDATLAPYAHAQHHDGRSYAQRNTTVELTRILAALGVIAAHLSDNVGGVDWLTAALMPLRVPFFYSISLFLFVASLPKTTPKQVAGRAWRRVLLPYLSWTFLYEVLSAAKALLSHSHYELAWWRILFYGESAIQLYFLPTLLMLQAMALGLYLLLAPGTTQRFTGGLLLAGAVTYYALGAHCRCSGMEEPSSLIAYAMYLLVAFWLAFIITKHRARTAYTILGGCLVLLVICCSALGYKMLVFGYPVMMPLGGVGTLLLTTGLPNYWRCGWLPVVTSLSFGIYLCHPLFIELFDFVSQYTCSGATACVLNIKTVEILLVFMASAILVLLLRRVKLIRQLLLGER